MSWWCISHLKTAKPDTQGFVRCPDGDNLGWNCTCIPKEDEEVNDESRKPEKP